MGYNFDSFDTLFLKEVKRQLNLGKEQRMIFGGIVMFSNTQSKDDEDEGSPSHDGVNPAGS